MRCVCTLYFFTNPLAHPPLKASFLTSAPSPPQTATFTYGETNGDRAFVHNPAKGELVCKCTTASTDCHIQIQPTSPYTHIVTCMPKYYNIIYNNHHMLPACQAPLPLPIWSNLYCQPCHELPQRYLSIYTA